MYLPAAVARRRCAAIRADGEPCRAWAAWDDPKRRCNAHAGRTRGPNIPPCPPWGHPDFLAWLERYGDARRPPSCRCAAYPFPHRHGAGACRWPEAPDSRSDPRKADPPTRAHAGGSIIPGQRRKAYEAKRRRLAESLQWRQP